MLSRKSITATRAMLFWAVLNANAHAVTTNWTSNFNGTFTNAAYWDNGVPDSDDLAVFNRGFVAYEVNFPGGSIFDPPLNYPINYLRVRTNEVSFVWTPVPFQRSPSLSVLNPDVSIVVGEDAGEVAILNMAINTLSGANASIGRATGATGTLNVGGTVALSGALNVGESGTGTMNVTNGGMVASTDGFIGPNAGSNGQVTVSGANSTWANSNSLYVGRVSSGTNAQLDVNDGGVVSATNGLRVNPTGRLAGNGLIQGNVENLGRVAPGISSPTSVGTLHIDGNYGQSIAAEMLVELAAADSFDKLDIDGNITLNGRLNVSLLNGYSPEVGATFDILDWTGTQNGTFFDISPLSVGLRWDTSQLYTIGVLSVVPAYFRPGDVITYIQGDWGDASSHAGPVLSSNFNNLYGQVGYVEVGIPGPGGHSMLFTSAPAVFTYQPTSGAPASLNADLLDPTSSASGIFGGEVLALRFNVDFSDAGVTLGTLGVPFGDLVIHDYASLPQVNGLSVSQVLAQAEILLGGGSLGYSITAANTLVTNLNASFSLFDGVPSVSQFAQDHLRIPGDFNLDRAVNAADYVVWRKTDGTQAGYNEWRANFGRTAGSGAISNSAPGDPTAANLAIPEPATLLPLAICGFVCLIRRCHTPTWRKPC